eukprot:scaffold3409_cov224-Chaetoceros_neogracile.AAC.1
MKAAVRRVTYVLVSIAIFCFYSSDQLERYLSRVLNAHEEETIELPPEFDHLIDLKEYFSVGYDKSQSSLTPFYWHVAKAAGTTVHSVYSQCYRLIEASEIGGFASSDKLEIVEANRNKNHLNVDVSTLEGIKHAKDVELVESRMAEIIISPLFYAGLSEIFSVEHRGLMFAMFRHPIKRSISLFSYLQHSIWEATYNPIFANMTMEEYAISPYVESNYITRSLINRMEGPLSPEDFDIAKEIVKRKCLVGLSDEFDGSINLFNEAIGFQPNFETEVVGEESANAKDKQKNVDRCLEDLRTGKGDGSNRHKHADVSEGSETYKVLESKNAYDLELWELIVDQYREQQLDMIEKDLGFKGFERSPSSR